MDVVRIRIHRFDRRREVSQKNVAGIDLAPGTAVGATGCGRIIAVISGPRSSQYRIPKTPKLRPLSSNGDVLAPGDNHERFQGCTVVKRGWGNNGETDAQLAVNMRVRVYPGTDAESPGVIVEDFGDLAGQAIEIGDTHFADPARRWAVVLDTGDLVFVDSDHLVPD